MMVARCDKCKEAFNGMNNDETYNGEVHECGSLVEEKYKYEHLCTKCIDKISDIHFRIDGHFEYVDFIDKKENKCPVK